MGSDVVPDWGQACNSTVYRIVWRSVKHFFRFPSNFFVKRFSTFSPFCRGKLFCHKIWWKKSFPRRTGEKVESFFTKKFEKSLLESEKNA